MTSFSVCGCANMFRCELVMFILFFHFRMHIYRYWHIHFVNVFFFAFTMIRVMIFCWNFELILPFLSWYHLSSYVDLRLARRTRRDKSEKEERSITNQPRQ